MAEAVHNGEGYSIDEFCGPDWGGIPKQFLASHAPIHGVAQASHAAAMFRQPLQRLLSSPGHPAGWPLLIRTLPRSYNLSVAEIARLPGKIGCMTKMLTGHFCASSLLPQSRIRMFAEDFAQLRQAGKLAEARSLLDEVSTAEAALLVKRIPEALSIVQTLAFVGIQEAWHASIVLFHARFQNGSRPAAPEFVAMRSKHTASYEAPHVYDTRVLENFWDEADHVIYNAAMGRFAMDVSTELTLAGHSLEEGPPL